jgi:hypothetical protein
MNRTVARYDVAEIAAEQGLASCEDLIRQCESAQIRFEVECTVAYAAEHFVQARNFLQSIRPELDRL